MSDGLHLIASLLLVASLFLVVRPGAPSSVLAPSSDALCSERSILASSFLSSPVGCGFLINVMHQNLMQGLRGAERHQTQSHPTPTY